MTVDGFVADDSNDAFGAKAVDDKASDDFGETVGTPPSMGKDSMIGRRVQWFDERE
ncbi:hypothetical protein Mal65_11230 [Crateriforma conspicua]|nr:hypothetical protein Mal65_11230 [Crateriforma conspicua]